MILYEVLVMKEARDYKDALEHMDNFQSSICDVLFLNETKGEVVVVCDRQPDSLV